MPHQNFQHQLDMLNGSNIKNFLYQNIGDKKFSKGGLVIRID